MSTLHARRSLVAVAAFLVVALALPMAVLAREGAPVGTDDRADSPARAEQPSTAAAAVDRQDVPARPGARQDGIEQDPADDGQTGGDLQGANGEDGQGGRRALGDRLPQPEDRYALASGCYAIELVGEGYVARDRDGLVITEAAAAEPFHFQATRLGEYLIAANEGPDTRWEDAWWDVRSYVTLADVAVTAIPPRTDAVVLIDQPTVSGEWVLVAAGDDPDRVFTDGEAPRFHLRPAKWSAAGMASDGGKLTVSESPAELAFHHVAEGVAPNGTRCAVWPEIDTNTSGAPAPAPTGPAGEVRGFFEAHVHGMAFEFLGGEARCGRPWHPYGVEYALVDCEDHGPGGHAAVLEYALSGQGADGHDTTGWPTFADWPRHDSLTHEQFYWRWLERAHHGGLRLVTNLLVDNTALCQLYPLKRNSCNEMDGVRLQAQRLHELQDYIDAQSGGPGEGWFRIVTSPAEAREVINAGKLAVVLGIEVSVLFDCGEVLDQPQCTRAQIDERLQEVFDMGVRQMELINKFDNAFSGVKGDGGATGLLVNTGNRHVTGHFWDMRTCPEDFSGADGHEHDHTQYNVADETPSGSPGDEIDVLAGAIIDAYGDATMGYVAPLYPAGPHCNERGLTELGEYLIRAMVAKGMVFDPDHMSARGQRAALDLIADEIVPQEHLAAAAEGRAPRLPAVISSHSWANEVTYKRIFALDGHNAPRTSSPEGFVGYWKDRRAWAEEFAPDGYYFGMGYGADTNGFGSQPGPSRDAALVDYDTGWEAPIGGVTIERQVSGLRAYDVNTEGVAHYGLFADWFRDVALAADADPEAVALGGGAAVMEDMLRGAESYLRMWERAVYGMNECVVDHSGLQHEDLHALLGANVEGFLAAVGRPLTREGSAYTYCVETEEGTVAVDVLFDSDGRMASVVPSAQDVTPIPLEDASHAHAVGLGLQDLPGGPAGPLLLALAVALSTRRLRTARV